MLEAPISKNEVERLETLMEYKILDTSPDTVYDDIVKYTSIICKMPIALISFLDEDRQWFKASIAFNISEIPRNISFCNHTIQQNDIFIVENALTDDRFKNNPLVIDTPKVVFYAGYPLQTPNGYNIGTISIIDHESRNLSQEQINCLKLFSKLIMSYLEGNRQHQKNNICSSSIIQKSNIDLIRKSNFNYLTEMVGGIAHEINNPLTIIQGKANIILNMLKNKKLDEEKCITHLEKIYLNCEKTAHIIKNYQSLANVPDRDPFISSSILKMFDLSMLVIKEKYDISKIDFRLKIKSNLEIECDEVKISKCFINIISNSIEAIKNLNEKWIEIETIDDNDNVEIIFTDSGSGIHDDNVIAHLMKPFFTTKEAGIGTGLGLVVAKGIIESHRGEIHFNYNYKNTQFVIHLPKKHG